MFNRSHKGSRTALLAADTMTRIKEQDLRRPLDLGLIIHDYQPTIRGLTDLMKALEQLSWQQID